MRTIVFLSALAFAAALSAEEEGTCIVNGAEAVSDALDASMFIWASLARCGKQGELVKCEIGVSSAITSVNSMINVILKAVDKCGALNTVNKDCGIAVSEMTKHMGGIASASGGVVQKCSQGPAHGVNWNHADPALCVINAKNTAKSLFKVIRSFMKSKGSCNGEDAETCTANALQIVGAFAGLGEFLAGTIGKCSPSGAYKGSVCAQQAERLVQQLTEFSERAINTAQKCGPVPPPPAPPATPETAPAAAAEGVLETSRLYSREAKQASAGINTNILLAAFLPVTAIVGFVGGRVYGSRRATSGTREMLPMSDVE